MRQPEDVANELLDLEHSIEQRLDILHKEYPEVMRQIEEIEADKDKTETLKKELRSLLVANDDFDAHEVGNKKFSVSKVIRLEAENMEEIPSEFKVVKEVADEKKAQDYYKLMGEAPKGFKDKSYHKLNWKEI